VRSYGFRRRGLGRHLDERGLLPRPTPVHFSLSLAGGCPLMTRVSEHFALGLAQPQLDFVDVDVRDRHRGLCRPTRSAATADRVGRDCVAFLQHYFPLRPRGHKSRRPREPTSCSVSSGSPTRPDWAVAGPARRHALGPTLAADVRDQLARSEALRTGLIGTRRHPS